MKKHHAPLARAAGVGALSGLRSIAGIAALSNGLAHRPEHVHGSLQQMLARPRVARGLTLAALGEIVADKMPGIPARIAPLPLTGRIVLGALAATAAADSTRDSRIAAAFVGGVAAAAAAFLAYHLRRDLTRHGTPDTVVAVAEDITVLEGARQTMRAIAH